METAEMQGKVAKKQEEEDVSREQNKGKAEQSQQIARQSRTEKRKMKWVFS